jgi:hypothetical protein
VDDHSVGEVPSPKLITLRVTMPMVGFEELEQACLRRGMPMETLLADGFVRAIVGDHAESKHFASREGLAGGRQRSSALRTRSGSISLKQVWGARSS